MSELQAAFASPDASVRLNAVMAAGIRPSPDDLGVLIERCAVEPDFQVREMLTWALIRLPADMVVPRLVSELKRAEPQARGQALHTLSKVRDGSAWPAVAARLDDSDPDVRRTAWYAAVALVPQGERGWLAGKLSDELGHGDPATRLSLSRALIGLGPEVIAPILATAVRHPDEAVREHAAATERLLRDPDSASSLAVETARREVGLGRTRSSIG